MNKHKRNIALLLIFIGAKGNIIAISDGLLLFTFFYTVFYIRFFKVPIPKSALYLLYGYIVLTILYMVKFNWVNYYSTIRFAMKMYTGFFGILILKEHLFYLFEKCLVTLSKVSLFFFPIQLIAYPYLKQFIGIFETLIPPLDYRGNWYVNNFIFTMNDNAMYRNSGFAWEPKGFANLLILAIFINLLRTGFTRNRNLTILFITILTTQSTTAIVTIFSMIPAFFLYNLKSQTKMLYFIISIFVGIGMFNLDIVGNKIINEFNNSGEHLKYMDVDTDMDKVTLGRFGSMQLALMDFAKNPILGIGMQDKFRTDSEFTHLVYVNGIADFLSRFGLVGMIFLAYTYYQSTKKITQYYNKKGFIFLFLSFLFIFFASAIIINPLYFAFEFYFLANLIPANRLSNPLESLPMVTVISDHPTENPK
ncbi:MAG: hypothetical protein K1X82_04715 [Bacteroidia bacterium]|nr:hypothetical protein [Bacteroidia bacterium]